MTISIATRNKRAAEAKVRLEAKRTYKLHEAARQLHTWSYYLKESAVIFLEQIEELKPAFTSTKTYNETVECLKRLKDTSHLLKNKMSDINHS